MSVREFGLIDRFFSNLLPLNEGVKLGIGDDAAVLSPPPDQDLLVCVDTLVSGVHFLASASAFDIGYKSLAVNVSDIAAMGGDPRWATLSLTIEEVNDDWLQDFANGFAALANDLGISLIGGDTSQGPLAISVQLLGSAAKGKSLTRSGAGEGELIYLSGYPGAAALACQKLLGEFDEIDVADDCYLRLHRPLPRIELSQRLVGLATAAIDVSDGLAADLMHLLQASHLGADIQLDSIPLCESLVRVSPYKNIMELVLCGGDDYELCFTVPEAKQENIEQIAEDLDYPLSCIGETRMGEGIHWVKKDGSEFQLETSAYEHFS